MFVFADNAFLYRRGWGVISEAKIPMQELEGQREEGAYFWEDTAYIFNTINDRSCHIHKLRGGLTYL